MPQPTDAKRQQISMNRFLLLTWLLTLSFINHAATPAPLPIVKATQQTAAAIALAKDWHHLHPYQMAKQTEDVLPTNASENYLNWRRKTRQLGIGLLDSWIIYALRHPNRDQYPKRSEEENQCIDQDLDALSSYGQRLVSAILNADPEIREFACKKAIAAYTQTHPINPKRIVDAIAHGTTDQTRPPLAIGQLIGEYARPFDWGVRADQLKLNGDHPKKYDLLLGDHRRNNFIHDLANCMICDITQARWNCVNQQCSCKKGVGYNYDLSNNLLTAGALRDLPCRSSVALCNNLIEHIDTHSDPNMPTNTYLKTLELRGNDIATIPDALRATAPCLEVLDLRDNPVTEILSNDPEVRLIDVPTERLSRETFQKLIQLEERRIEAHDLSPKDRKTMDHLFREAEILRRQNTNWWASGAGLLSRAGEPSRTLTPESQRTLDELCARDSQIDRDKSKLKELQTQYAYRFPSWLYTLRPWETATTAPTAHEDATVEGRPVELPQEQQDKDPSKFWLNIQASIKNAWTSAATFLQAPPVTKHTCTTHPTAAALTDEHVTAAAPAASTHTCTILGCKNKATKLCGKCRTKRYCSSSCQEIDWPTHKAHCFPRATTTCSATDMKGQ
jgi:hypothetical protein